MKSLTVIILFLHTALVTFGAVKYETLADADKALSETIDQMLTILYEDTESTQTEKEQRVEACAEQSFAFAVISRRVLGREWNRFSEEQQEAFTDKFQKLLMRSYTKRFAESEKPELSYQDPVILAKRRAEIRSTAKVDGQSYAIDYRLAELPDLGWQVYDMIIEGVSLTGNYRSQFASLLNRNSPADVLNTLDEKITSSAE